MNGLDSNTHRFTGAQCTFELDGDFRDVVLLEGAILRPDRLVLDFAIGDDHYTASLLRIDNANVLGSWSCRGTRHASGAVEGSLSPFKGRQGWFGLNGTWEDNGRRRKWFVRLTPTEKLEDA